MTLSFLRALALVGGLITVSCTTVKLPTRHKPTAGLTPLHLAAYAHDQERLTELIGPETELNVRDQNGQTPLHFALRLSDPAPTVLQLCVAGADPNVADIAGMTPLHLAAMTDRVESIRILAEHGAKVDLKTREGMAPIHLAAEAGHVRAIQALAKCGANVILRNSFNERPVDVANLHEREEAAAVLELYTQQYIETGNVTPVGD